MWDLCEALESILEQSRRRGGSKGGGTPQPRHPQQSRRSAPNWNFCQAKLDIWDENIVIVGLGQKLRYLNIWIINDKIFVPGPEKLRC